VVAYINSNINIAGFHSFSLGSRNRNKERSNSQDEHNQPKGEKQFHRLLQRDSAIVDRWCQSVAEAATTLAPE
jgi:hypothetical protein